MQLSSFKTLHKLLLFLVISCPIFLYGKDHDEAAELPLNVIEQEASDWSKIFVETIQTHVAEQSELPFSTTPLSAFSEKARREDALDSALGHSRAVMYDLHAREMEVQQLPNILSALKARLPALSLEAKPKAASYVYQELSELFVEDATQKTKLHFVMAVLAGLTEYQIHSDAFHTWALNLTDEYFAPADTAFDELIRKASIKALRNGIIDYLNSSPELHQFTVQKVIHSWALSAEQKLSVARPHQMHITKIRHGVVQVLNHALRDNQLKAKDKNDILRRALSLLESAHTLEPELVAPLKAMLGDEIDFSPYPRLKKQLQPPRPLRQQILSGARQILSSCLASLNYARP